MEFEVNVVLPPRSFDENDAFCSESENGLKRKHNLKEEFEKIDEEKGSSDHLLIWSGQPNEDDDDDRHEKQRKKITTCYDDINEKNDKDEKQIIVGWPPIKSLRKSMINRSRCPGNNYGHRPAGQIGNNPAPTIASKKGSMKFRV